jgi:hypothetical protein
MVTDPIVDGAMCQSLMKMERREPDVLMLEMTHGIVVINMILLPVHQDGLVMRELVNALWQTQVMVLEVNQLVPISANHMALILIDAILLLVSVKNVKLEILDVIKIETLHVETVYHQFLQQVKNSSAIKLIQNNQHVISAQRISKMVVNHTVKPVLAVIQSKNFSNVIQKRLHAYKLNNKVTLNKLVMLNVDILHHKNFSEPGEVLWPRKVNHQCLIWEKLT